MRTWIPLALIGALCVVAVLFGLGVFDGPASEDPAPEEPPVIPRPEPEVETPALVGTGDDAPPDKPAIEPFEFQQPVNVLLLLSVPQRFPAFLGQQWGADRQVTVLSWTAPSEVTEGSGPPPATAMPNALGRVPRPGLLDDEKIDVLAIHDLDPKHIPDDFWVDAVARVRDGRMGLLLLPGLLHGKAMLEHPELKKVAPVVQAAEIRGPKAPGIFGATVPFRITAAGVGHPASRLVPWPTWSQRYWDAARLVETPWGTRFCYPVTEVSEGAKILVEVDPPQAERLPALIAGPDAGGRVLWFGAWDLGELNAYGRPAVVYEWGALVKAWIAWASGQAPI